MPTPPVQLEEVDGRNCLPSIFLVTSTQLQLQCEIPSLSSQWAGSVVGNIIQSFNKLQPSKMVYLNEPEVWVDLTPDSAGRKSKSLIEPFIEGTYRKFNSNTAHIDNNYDTMQALSHYSYHKSDGQRLVCDLQGGYYNDYYVLTDPVVCSLSQEFGVTDLGAKGIENFFAHHQCNHRCQSHWKKPEAPMRRFAPVSATTFRRPC